ncbi:MAG: hypothetical protein ACLUFH_00700 [Monoglobales bacterium]
MMKNNGGYENTTEKQIVRTTGAVQFPIRVGEEACYQQRGYLMWTDCVKKILEIASDSVCFETTSYCYIIENRVEAGQIRLVA